MTNSRLFLALLVVVGIYGCARMMRSGGAEDVLVIDAPEQHLSAERLEADLRFLAADELMGRRAGEPGADIAARYIAEQFRTAGVQPVPGAEQGYFQTVPLQGGASSVNVIGWIEGSDPELRDEYVLLTAHYDHVGAGADRRGATPADSIFNGARDNAMGTVAVIGAARAFAEAPPRRSVLLLAVTAEEMGLIGSRYYADHPLVPLRRVVFNLNIDGAGYSDTSIVTVIGLERTTAEPLIEQGANAFGLDAIADPAPEANLFDRSDNVAFAAKGIPAPTFSPGFRAFDDSGVANYYHQVTDEADDLDYAYLTAFVRAYAHTARLIADADDRPRWHPGDKYEDAFRTLYGE